MIEVRQKKACGRPKQILTRRQALLITTLIRAGASIQPLYVIGECRPSMIVGFQGKNFLLYVKGPMGRNNQAQDHLSEKEQSWCSTWKGQVAVVKDEMEALTAIGAL